MTILQSPFSKFALFLNIKFMLNQFMQQSSICTEIKKTVLKQNDEILANSIHSYMSIAS